MAVRIEIEAPERDKLARIELTGCDGWAPVSVVLFNANTLKTAVLVPHELDLETGVFWARVDRMEWAWAHLPVVKR